MTGRLVLGFVPQRVFDMIKVWEDTTDKFEVVHASDSNVFMLSGYTVVLASKDCIYLCLPEYIEKVTNKLSKLMDMIKG